MRILRVLCLCIALASCGGIDHGKIASTTSTSLTMATSHDTTSQPLAETTTSLAAGQASGPDGESIGVTETITITITDPEH